MNFLFTGKSSKFVAYVNSSPQIGLRINSVRHPTESSSSSRNAMTLQATRREIAREERRERPNGRKTVGHVAVRAQDQKEYPFAY